MTKINFYFNLGLKLWCSDSFYTTGQQSVDDYLEIRNSGNYHYL